MAKTQEELTAKLQKINEEELLHIYLLFPFCAFLLDFLKKLHKLTDKKL